jgi:hypothetical protein
VCDQSRVKIAEKSRRIGISWADAAESALTASRSPSDGGSDCLYLGYNKEMSETYINDVADWAKQFQVAASEVQQSIITDEDKDILVFRVRFASGHKVAALSSKPNNLRSRKGRIVLDELAFHDHPEELLKAAMATLVWGGRVAIISTHNSTQNKFYEICDDIKTGKLNYSLHRTTIDDAIREGLYKRICQVQGIQWLPALEGEWRSQLFADYGVTADEELLCIPGNWSGTRAFNHFDRHIHTRAIDFNRSLPLHLSFDFNRSPATCAIGQVEGLTVNILDEIYLLNSDTFALGRAARLICQSLSPYLIYIHGDASGRAMTANSQQSNWDIISNALSGLPLNWQVPTCNPPIADTLNAANSLLYQGRVVIDSRCKELIKDLETCKLDANGKLDKKSDPLRAQIGDGFRYLCFDLFPLQSSNARGAIVGGAIAKVKF